MARLARCIKLVSFMLQFWKQFRKKYRKTKRKYRGYIQLTGKNYSIATAMLRDVAQICEQYDINYALDAGTLLGIARDGDLIPWDHDMDITLPSTEVARFKQYVIPGLERLGWRVSGRYRLSRDDVAWRKGDLRSIKIRNHRFPKLRLGRGRITMDVFITYEHGEHVWWANMGKVCRVSAHHFKCRETLSFHGQNVKVPQDYETMLEFVYGPTWRIPDPSFRPSRQDGSILRNTTDPIE